MVASFVIAGFTASTCDLGFASGFGVDAFFETAAVVFGDLPAGTAFTFAADEIGSVLCVFTGWTAGRDLVDGKVAPSTIPDGAGACWSAECGGTLSEAFSADVGTGSLVSRRAIVRSRVADVSPR